MEMYKDAVRRNLKFSTVRGLLTLQQLWELSVADLASAVREVKKILKKTDDDELSFLEDTKVIDVENQLRFEILKDVYVTRKKEAEERRATAEAKAFNAKIDALIAEKKEDALKGKSIEELEAIRKQV